MPAIIHAIKITCQHMRITWENLANVRITNLNKSFETLFNTNFTISLYNMYMLLLIDNTVWWQIPTWQCQARSLECRSSSFTILTILPLAQSAEGILLDSRNIVTVSKPIKYCMHYYHLKIIDTILSMCYVHNHHL